MKKLFTLIAALVCAVCVNAEDYEFSLTDLGSGYGSSYDPATKTITFEGEWKGRGWWLGDVDLSAYTKIVVECEALTTTGQIVIQYDDDSNSTGSAGAGSTKIEANLNPEKSLHVKQVYLQTDKAGTITLVKAYATWVDPSIIWEGSVNFGTAWDWNSTIGLAGSAFANIKSGEYIEFEYTINGAESYHQIKALFGQWGNENHEMITSIKEVANDNDCASVENGTTSIAFKLTDEDIATLKSNGLRVSGYDITLTKIRSTSTPTAISETLAPAKVENNIRYNLLGVKNGNGVYIMNGKKYIK